MYRTLPGRRRLRGAVAAAALGALTLIGLVAAGYAAPNQTASQAQYAPRNTSPPTISGTAQEGQTLTANPGTWEGTQPIVFTYQWRRCNPNGKNCVDIPDAKEQRYTVRSVDVGNTLRVVVTAMNASGKSSATSAPTARVQRAGPPPPPPGPAGQVRLPNGKVSIPVSSVSLPHRLIIDRISFSPSPVRSRRTAITARVHVSDARGFVVRDALVFIRSLPLHTTTPPEQATRLDGWVVFKLFPKASFPLGRFNVQFFARARKPGESLLAGVSTRRLAQVGTARPR